jgi:hypothetical protein
VIIDELRPAVIHDPDSGNADFAIADGHRWWINVDAGAGDVVSTDRCF